MEDIIRHFPTEDQVCKFHYVFRLEGIIVPPLSELSLEEIVSVPLDEWDGERRYLGEIEVEDTEEEEDSWETGFGWPFG